MSIELISVLGFIVVMTAMAILYRKARLDKLELLPEEEVIFEECNLKVKQAGSPQTSIFLKSMVRVTNKRIIISQKTLFGSKFVLRHVITYSNSSSETHLSSTLKKGYLIMNINKSDVKISEDSTGTEIRINIPESYLTKGQYITFNTKRKEDFSRIFQ